MHGVCQRIQDPTAEARDEAGPALPHLYLALTECGHRDGGRPMRGTAAAIWQAIDRLRAEGGRTAEIKILEQVSIEVHRLGAAAKTADATGDIVARRRITALTGEWLGVARLGV